MASVILQRAQVLDSMVDLLRQQAARFGERTAYVFLDDQEGEVSISFRELDIRAKAIAANLRTELEPGDRALLIYPAGLEFITAFFGCLYAGVVAVPATYPKPRRPLPRMASIARDSGALVALTTSQTLDTVDMSQQDEAVASMRWLATDEVPSSEAENWTSPGLDSEQLAFLQYTSGSTSDPKGVMVSHGNLLANLEAIRQSFGIEVDHTGRDIATGVFWLPAYHDMGLIGGILTPLFVGGRSVLMAPASFLQKPLRWLEAIDKYGATISGAPNFAYEYCVKRTTEEERAKLDFSAWQLAFCGAEPIRAETVRQFTSAFAVSKFRPDAFYPCYGLAENTLLAAGSEHRREPTVLRVDRESLAAGNVQVVVNGSSQHAQELVGSGTAPAEHRVEIVHPLTGSVCPEGVVGEVLLQGPSVAQGYFGRAEEINRNFHTRVRGVEGEFLSTGDLGFFYEGELFVTGRLKDVIIIRGRNHYPQDIETTAEAAHEALMPGAAFSITVGDEERLVVVNQIDRQLSKAEYPKVVSAIRQAIADQHELDCYAIVLIRQSSLPVTSSGKVQRSLTRDQYMEAKLRVVHEWKQSARPATNGKAKRPGKNGSGTNGTLLAGDVFGVEQTAERIEAWLEEWLVDRIGLDPAEMHRDKPFAEFGVDSLTAVELSHELEEEFGVPLPPIVAWNYPTPAALSRYLAEQSIGQQEPAAEQATDEAAAPVDDAELEAMLAEIENLSDEDAERLLEGE
ncbi:AMP-binding protein [Aeoliella mucimassa]|uniref:Long-chain-fatty-acid--AMP ligase FadD29 n=1 Tax=Aeoliella mucimassa TaxID=2527972 RepID=A0A518ASR6_9BACT|nr:AMP-binding protein [Aeoliella mucimassa]QDU57771.1 Long-chain-fatty-acid--AMP ligase FadD29 [Aeoliella mucimassa]